MNPWERYAQDAPSNPWDRETSLGPATKKQPDAINPMDGIPWYQQFAEGMGKGFVDLGRGVGQLGREGIELVAPPQKGVSDLVTGGRGKSFADTLGLPTRADIDAARKRDAALTDTGWGMTGDIAGNVIPAMLLPGSTLLRAGAIGAGLGFSQPVGTNDSRAMNTLEGGAFGAAVPAAFKVGKAIYGAGRSLIEPIAAPRNAAARLVDQFADDPQALRLAAANAGEIIPGAKPTLAEIAQQPGISTLQRGVANQPGPMQAALTGRGMDQNAARLSYLDNLAGTDGRLDFSKASRDTAANDLYSKAFAEVPEDSRWIKGQVTKLTQRPAFVSALKDGQEMAMNLGIKVSPDNPENTTQILHFTKMALDDKIAAAVQGGNKNASRALIDTRDSLVSLMESKGFSPSYREARDTYKQMSGPINEMELAGDLRSKFVPALNDVTGTTPTKVYADGMAGEVRRRSGDLAKLSPEFQSQVSALTSDLQRKAAAEALGKPSGSPTAQYLTTQNLMRQALGPLGLPESMADKAAGMLMGTPGVGSVMGAVMKGPEQRVQQEVGNLLLNPSDYAAASRRLVPRFGNKRFQVEANPYLPALAASGLFSANNGRQ